MSQPDVLEAPAGVEPQIDSSPPQSDGGESPVADTGKTESPDFSNPETLAAAFDQLDPDELANLLADGENQEVVEDRIEVENPDQARGDDPEPETEDQAKAETPEPDQDTTPDRIRLKGLPKKEKHRIASAVNAVKDGTYDSFNDAYSDLYGAPKAAEVNDEGEAPEAGNPEPVVPEPVALVDSDIERLKSERKEARSDFDNDTADDLTDQINAKLLERQQVLNDVAASAKADNEFVQKYRETAISLREAHPELNDFDSPLSKRVGELRDLKEFAASKGDEEAQASLRNPQFIADLVSQAATDIGMGSRGSTPPPPPVRNAPQRQGQVSPANATTGSLSTEASLSLLDNLSYDDLMKVGDAVGQ